MPLLIIEIHWHDSTYQEGYDSMMENNATCQGGFIFEWTDEWNKIDTPTVHNPSTVTEHQLPGRMVGRGVVRYEWGPGQRKTSGQPGSG